jgi:hypothetical protein
MMTVGGSSADAPVQEESRRKPWSVTSLVVSAVVLVGMFLPWISGIDLGSFIPAAGRVNGWNVGWLPIPILIGIALCVGLGFAKVKLLGLVAMLCCCIASLIPVVSLGTAILGSSDEGVYGTFIVASQIPLVGFWVTLLGIVGMILFGVAFGIKIILPDYRGTTTSG